MNLFNNKSIFRENWVTLYGFNGVFGCIGGS